MFAARLIVIVTVTVGLIGTARPAGAQEPDPADQVKARPMAVPRHLAGEAPPATPAAAPVAASTAAFAADQRNRSRGGTGRAQGRQGRPAPSGRSTGPAQGQRRAVPRSSRPREDNPPTGRAAPRGRVPAPPVARPPSYRPSYRPYYRPYRPRYYSPYYYGAFGFSYFYWDPSWYGSGGYGPGYMGPSPYYGDIGSVRLKVKPRDAQVFVDGYFVGAVDEFDGTFQRLRLPSGPHRIEVRAPGFEPAVFEVYVRPDQTITFERILQPLP